MNGKNSIKQEEKDLLLRDLCARLSYKVKVQIKNVNGICTLEEIDCNDNEMSIAVKHENGKLRGYDFDLSRPYLFPLSNITEEQYKEFIIISGWDGDIEDIRRGKFSCIGYIGLDYIYDTIDWFNKYHFDYRGLIEKELALDATGLNIY